MCVYIYIYVHVAISFQDETSPCSSSQSIPSSSSLSLPLCVVLFKHNYTIIIVFIAIIIIMMIIIMVESSREQHTCHILPHSEIDGGLFLAGFAGSGGKCLFHRIGWKGRIWQLRAASRTLGRGVCGSRSAASDNHRANSIGYFLMCSVISSGFMHVLSVGQWNYN